LKKSDHETHAEVISGNLIAEDSTGKGKDQARWDKYSMVTVLFSDIQGFTKIAESTNPEVLIDELDRFFFHFDSVVEKYNIEKIKTIGDAYMAAGGIPRKNKSNPIEVVLAALEMQLYMKQLKNTKVDFWDLRIGIHSGPVIAGVVGHKKRSYDIWGDTVNTASRMESSGEAGKVNISGVTYSLIKEFFICEYRGKLPVKYKGNIDMYFVKGLRPELSVNLAGIPNRKFYLKLQMLRLEDLEDQIFGKLEAELPKNLYFHNLDYARHLFTLAGLFSKAEDLDGEDTLLLLTSILLMNVGYIHSYESPEKYTADYSLSILTQFNYSEDQIAFIQKLIHSHKSLSFPQTIIEQILHDIRTEYLGRADFLKLYKLLFLEQNEYRISTNVDEFKKDQIRVIQNHRFYTKTAIHLMEVPADEQIRKIAGDEWS
jgi:class 3 adenylate cyclase